MCSGLFCAIRHTLHPNKLAIITYFNRKPLTPISRVKAYAHMIYSSNRPCLRGQICLTSKRMGKYVICLFMPYHCCPDIFYNPTDRELGISCTDLAKQLGMSQPGVGYAVNRGEKIAKEHKYQLL